MTFEVLGTPTAFDCDFPGSGGIFKQLQYSRTRFFNQVWTEIVDSYSSLNHEEILPEEQQQL